MGSLRENPSKLLTAVLVLIGAIITVLVALLLFNSLFFDGSTIAPLEAIMSVNESVVGLLTPFSYTIALLFWTVLLLLVGVIWSYALFPHVDFIERILFSFVFGLFVIPLNYTIIAIVSVVYQSLTNNAPLLSTMLSKELLYSDHIYAAFNLFAILLIGIMVLVIREVLVPAKRHTA